MKNKESADRISPAISQNTTERANYQEKRSFAQAGEVQSNQKFESVYQEI